MNPCRSTLLAAAFTAVALLAACAAGSADHSISAPAAGDAGTVARVLLLSVHGPHEEDVTRCLAASTCLHIAALIATTQVEPALFAALKLDPALLQAVKAERTPARPDITFS